MSSTSTYFQAPHSLSHMDRYTDMGSHHPHYSDNGFSSQLTDYGSADANAYSPHDDYHYDESPSRYNHIPPGIGLFDLGDLEPHHHQTPGPLAYGHTQNMNPHESGYASPELVSPKPTLPPQFPPQFSWSNWPSEAPNGMNVYRTYSEPSHQRHTNSFDNPHTISSPTYYPVEQEFSEGALDPESSIPRHHHHGDDGYAHQPFLPPSSFERLGGHPQSLHSINIQHKYHAAHQPVLPEQRSSYSELAPNLTFMNNQSQPSVIRQEKVRTKGDRYATKDLRKDAMISRTRTPSRDVKKNPFALGLNGPPLTAIGRKATPPLAPLNRVVRYNRDPVASDHAMADNTTTTTTTAAAAPPKPRPTRNVNEPRRPSLACTFCRERKIACSRPPEGSPDLTCNQCARRSFTCHYLDSKSATSSSTPSALSTSHSKDPSPPPPKCK